MSAVSQKVTARVPGDAGCYRLTAKKKEEKLSEKEGETGSMTERTQTCDGDARDLPGPFQ